jgi:hypothetical protein
MKNFLFCAKAHFYLHEYFALSVLWLSDFSESSKLPTITKIIFLRQERSTTQEKPALANNSSYVRLLQFVLLVVCLLNLSNMLCS